jgi:hypothetical protein
MKKTPDSPFRIPGSLFYIDVLPGTAKEKAGHPGIKLYRSLQML